MQNVNTYVVDKAGRYKFLTFEQQPEDARNLVETATLAGAVGGLKPCPSPPIRTGQYRP